MRIALNGLGRIGRCLTRLLCEHHGDSPLELVAINDVADFDILAHLLQFDSTHGRFGQAVSRQDDHLVVGTHRIQLLSEKQLSALPWRALDIDCVVECSGKFKQREQLQDHLDAGAQRVITSHPVADADLTVVYGVNHQLLDTQRIISNASCTTNCLAPLVQVLDQAFGVEQGFMTTIHAYTNDQNLIDKAHTDPLRARSAARSMVPTATGAAKAVGQVLPHLDGKLNGMAVRVPTDNVSLVDFHGLLHKEATIDSIHQAFREASAGALAGILEVNELPLVSVDFNHQPASCIVDCNQTAAMKQHVKVMAWYDNEWGFSHRLLDVLKYWQRA